MFNFLVLQSKVTVEEREGKADRKRDRKNNISEWTGLGLGEALGKAEERGTEKSGCQIILDASTVIQTMECLGCSSSTY